MNQARRMKKSLKAKETYKDFPKSYHGKLLDVIIKEKIERDIFSIKDQFINWKYKSQVLLVRELEGVEQTMENDIRRQVPKEQLSEIISITDSLYINKRDKDTRTPSREEITLRLATEVFQKLVSCKAIDANNDLYLSLINSDYILHNDNQSLQPYTLIYDAEDRKKSKKFNCEKLLRKYINRKTDSSLRFEKFYFIRWKIQSIRTQISSLFKKLSSEYAHYIEMPISDKKILNVTLIDDTIVSSQVDQIVN